MCGNIDALFIVKERTAREVRRLAIAFYSFCLTLHFAPYPMTTLKSTLFLYAEANKAVRKRLNTTVLVTPNFFQQSIGQLDKVRRLCSAGWAGVDGSVDTELRDAPLIRDLINVHEHNYALSISDKSTDDAAAALLTLHTVGEESEESQIWNRLKPKRGSRENSADAEGEGADGEAKGDEEGTATDKDKDKDKDKEKDKEKDKDKEKGKEKEKGKGKAKDKEKDKEASPSANATTTPTLPPASSMGTVLGTFAFGPLLTLLKR